MVRAYVRFLPDDADFNAFLSEFHGESERAAAVLAAAYLDELRLSTTWPALRQE